MELAEAITRKVDAHLGVHGRPHQVFLGGYVDTGCTVWPLPRSSAPLGGLLDYYDFLAGWTGIFQEDPSLHAVFAQASGGRQNLSYQEWREACGQVVRASKRRDELEPLLAHIDALVADCPPSVLQGNAMPDIVECLLPADPRQRVHPALWEVRDLLAGEDAFAYLTLTGIANEGETAASQMQPVDYMAAEYGYVTGDLVVVPSTDPYDALRVERTNADNYGLDTEEVIARLKKLDAEYGVDIVAAGYDYAGFLLKRRPEGTEAARVGQWLLDFCPDLYEAPAHLDRAPVTLWWD